MQLALRFIPICPLRFVINEDHLLMQIWLSYRIDLACCGYC